jgi:hypothetical protein
MIKHTLGKSDITLYLETAVFVLNMYSKMKSYNMVYENMTILYVFSLTFSLHEIWI